MTGVQTCALPIFFNTPDGILGTPANLSGKNKLFMVPYENLNFKINARSLGGKILIPKTATVFRLPLPNDLTVDCMDEELYEIANGSYFGDNNNYTGVAYYSGTTSPARSSSPSKTTEKAAGAPPRPPSPSL